MNLKQVPKKYSGVRRIFVAFKYSYQGFVSCFQTEAAFRQELALMLVLMPVVVWVDLPLSHKSLLVMSLGLVVIVELLNSAIEACVDRIGSEYHALSGKAKDIGSAAVLTSLMMAFMCWVLLLYPKFNL